jgi:hypothetical protein
MKKIRSKIFACFYEIVYLLIMKIHSNRFQGSCSGFPIVTLKVVPKATCDPKIVPKAAMNVHCQKSTVAKESLNRNLLYKRRLLKQSLEIVSVFKELCRNFIFIFLFNLKIILICSETTDLKV